MPYYVYILQSQKDKKYYIGETADVLSRLLFHNAGKQRSTRYRIPVVIVLIEEFETREEVLYSFVCADEYLYGFESIAVNFIRAR